MSKTLDEIRKKLQQLDSKRNAYSKSSSDKTTYPHWNIAEGTSAIVRFLPDANQDNTFFWVERQLIKLPFPGVRGQDENKPVVVQVPCVEMWDGPKTCPILNEVRPMWQDPSLEETARKYWAKKTYFAQGLVKQDPMREENAPENPIRKFIIGPQIFAIMKAALLDPDMENSPVDYINGTDFIISKTSKGGFADYGTSKWARKESSLTDDQMAAIEQYGLVDLSTYLPKRPTPEQMSAMFEMFQASLDGELYDPERWSQFYKPYGFDSGEDTGEGAKEPRSTAPKSVPTRPSTPVVTKPVIEEDVEVEEEAPVQTKTTPVSTTTASAPAKSPQEILAMIKNRNK